MAVESQADDPEAPYFPEHQRWRRAGVVFTTLHVVGSRNALAPFEGRGAADDAEVDERIAAAVSWLRESFAQARALEAPAVVVALHANPFQTPAEGRRSGFEEVLAALSAEAAAFRRPVLLIHGDTHTFRVDQPLVDSSGSPVENVTRLETYGDPVAGWVEVAVDLDGDPLFRVAGRPVG